VRVPNTPGSGKCILPYIEGELLLRVNREKTVAATSAKSSFWDTDFTRRKTESNSVSTPTVAGSGILTHTITNKRLARDGYYYSILDWYESLHLCG
jgi:hypothetical protein